MENRKRQFLISLMLMCFFTALYAQVDREELGRGQSQIEFENFTGTPTQINTRNQIRGIGYDLGQAIRNGSLRSGTNNRYFVIHSVTDPEGNRLDADIFGLGPGVGVDHIRNLRLIIQGYLEAAYAYSAQDASLLAQYITIYNAVFRGNWNFFTNTYKTAVMQHLTRERVGLSTRYSEWPGRSLIVIPLGNSRAGSSSAIDTSELSDPKVIDELMKEDNGVDRRNEMADLKDREADEAYEDARRIREEIEAEEARLAAEREALEREREALERERDSLTAQEIGNREAEIAQGEQALMDRESALDQQREVAQQAEDFGDQRRAEAEEDRRNIAGESSDSNNNVADAESEEDRRNIAGESSDLNNNVTDSVENQTGAGVADSQTDSQVASVDDDNMEGGFIVDESGVGLGIVGLVLTGNSPMGSIVRVNPSTGEILQRSRVNINVRTAIFINNRIVALAGLNNEMHLAEFDINTLEITRQSDDIISNDSLLWFRGNNLYAIVSSNGVLYLARFDTSLSRMAQSEIPIHNFSGLTFLGDNSILAQRNNGQMLVLDPITLTQ